MDILFTPTPKKLDDAACLRRYRAAKAVSEALGEPIQSLLRDWAPCHISRFEDMDKGRGA